jgi:BTB/POZ domain
VTLVLSNGTRRIPAHRIVLSSASDYFAAMFTSDVREATQNEVNMRDVDPDAMVALVKYMYDGQYHRHSLKIYTDSYYSSLMMCPAAYEQRRLYYVTS